MFTVMGQGKLNSRMQLWDIDYSTLSTSCGSASAGADAKLTLSLPHEVGRHTVQSHGSEDERHEGAHTLVEIGSWVLQGVDGQVDLLRDGLDRPLAVGEHDHSSAPFSTKSHHRPDSDVPTAVRV